MRQLWLVALHVEGSAGESQSFGLMLCSVSVSQERPSGLGPEEVGSRLCFCLVWAGVGGYFIFCKKKKKIFCVVCHLSKQHSKKGVYFSSRFVSLSGCRRQLDPTKWPFSVLLMFLKQKREQA